MARKVGSKGKPGSKTVPGVASLRVVRGFYEGLDIPIDGERLVIGRGEQADVVIEESTMSRQHAAFGYGGDGYFVEDLGSTNGTLVNGESQKRAVLHDGDEVRLGKLWLRVRLAS
jgi:pSer/pThr/pTyr-binding forkhead associated (FHA) protein